MVSIHIRTWSGGRILTLGSRGPNHLNYGIYAYLSTRQYLFFYKLKVCQGAQKKISLSECVSTCKLQVLETIFCDIYIYYSS